MMTWIVEQPIPLIVIGVLLAGILAGGWIQTGIRWLLVASGVVVLLTVALVILERQIVTDREQVELTLREIAAAVEHNDLATILSYVDSGSREIRRQAESEFPKYHFKRVSIKHNLEIKVSPDHVPPEAVATFNVVVTASDRAGVWGEETVPRWVEVVFWKEGDVWRVHSYRHEQPLLRRDGQGEPP